MQKFTIDTITIQNGNITRRVVEIGVPSFVLWLNRLFKGNLKIFERR